MDTFVSPPRLAGPARAAAGGEGEGERADDLAVAGATAAGDEPRGGSV